MRTVLDLYQGELFIRCGHHFLTIQIAHDAWRQTKRIRYKATVTKYPGYMPEFKGNLLVIMIPLRYGDK